MPDDELPDVGNPSGFIAYQISIGSSARESLKQFREAGGHSGDRVWRSLYAQTLDTINRTPDFLALDPNAIPSPNDLGTWQMGRGGQYATQVIIHQRDTETGLTSSTFYTVVRDEPHSKEEATAQALADFGADTNEEKYGMEVVGAFALHGWQTEAWGT